MSPQDWEERLRDLARTATRLRDGPAHESWQFDADGKPFRLHFYPSGTPAVLAGMAAREYAALQTLQRLKVPALRPVLLLRGLRFGDRTGDGVVLALPTPGGRTVATLEDESTSLAVKSTTVRDGVLAVLDALHNAGLGHGDLRPSTFVVSEGRVLLAEAAGLVQGGIRPEHLQRFAHTAGDRISKPDRVRAWRRLVPGGDVPPDDRRAAKRFRRDLRGENVVRFTAGDWTGRLVNAPRVVDWSAASAVTVSAEDWQRAWPSLVQRLHADTLDVFKRDASGDVTAATVSLGGRPVDVVLKRPLEKYWYRRLTSLTRASRARRAWDKARLVRGRGIAVEPPLAVFERRHGLGVESVAVFERVPGETLEKIDLDAMTPGDRDTLMRRCGRLLRRLEDTRLAHTDAKSSNWIVFHGSPAAGGPRPVLIDAYGIRWLNPWVGLFGLHRLLRAMKKHPQYTPADSLAICQGFAPRATPAAEATPPRRAADGAVPFVPPPAGATKESADAD